MNKRDRSTFWSFVLYSASGIFGISAAAVLGGALLPHISSSVGILLARVVHTCSQLLSTVAGRDIFLSSLNALILLFVGAFFLTGAGLFFHASWKTGRYVSSLRKKIFHLSDSRKKMFNTMFPSLTLVGVDDQHPFVVSAGLFKPKIYVSAGLLTLLSDDELVSVFKHEEYHCRNRDTARLFIVHFFRKLFWFVPGISKFAAQVQTLFEISADEHAIHALGDDTALGSALVKVLRHPSHSAIPELIPAFSSVNDRIGRLLDASYKPSTRAAVAVPIFGILFLLLSVFFARGSFAAPNVAFDGFELHKMSQSRICPQIVPELLMSVPQNRVCVHPQNSTQAPSCGETHPTTN